jgi:hypothetical protein
MQRNEGTRGTYTQKTVSAGALKIIFTGKILPLGAETNKILLNYDYSRPATECVGARGSAEGVPLTSTGKTSG